VAVWGLAFKPNTDDVRESPAIELVRDLVAAGAKVRAHDPKAVHEAQKALGPLAGVTYVEDPYQATDGADVLCLMTEWRPYRRPDFHRLAGQLKAKVIFDGRNQYEDKRASEHGLTVHPIGVPAKAAFAVAANAVQAHLRAVHHLLSEAMPSATQVVLLDEPDVAGLHAASFPLAPDAALDILSGCLATLGGSAITGIHCCATEVDLSSLLAAGPSVLSIPVHSGVVAAAGYLATFLDNGGWIAWGVVPTDRPIATSADRYWRELSALWCELVQAGCDAATLRRRCIVTPACGLGLYELDQAGGVLAEVRDIAERVIGQAVATRLSLGA